MSNSPQFQRIVIFGAGAVGTSFAAMAIDQGLAREIVLFDARRVWLSGQVMDLQDRAIQLHRYCQVWVGKMADCHTAQLLVLTAAAPLPVGPLKRDQSAQANAVIVTEIIQAVQATKFAGFVIVVTNPVDQITYLVHRLTDWPQSKIIGTGTSLDAIRVQSLLQHYYQIRHDRIQPTVFGEHGVNLLLPQSLNQISGDRYFWDRHPAFWQQLPAKVIDWPLQMVSYKTNTHFGISNIIYQISQALLQIQPQRMCLGIKLEHLVVGYPCWINQTGIAPLTKLDWSITDQAQFHQIQIEMYRKQTTLWKFINKKFIKK